MEELRKRFNGSEADLAAVFRLIETGHKIAAIKLLCTHTDMSLKVAKEYADALEAGPAGAMQSGQTTHTSTSLIRVTREGGQISVTMSDGTGAPVAVTPADPLWQTVKQRLPGNKMLEEYERSFADAAMQPPPEGVFVPPSRSVGSRVLQVVAGIVFAVLIIGLMRAC